MVGAQLGEDALQRRAVGLEEEELSPEALGLLNIVLVIGIVLGGQESAVSGFGGSPCMSRWT